MMNVFKLLLMLLLALNFLQAKEVSLENKISSLYISFFNRAADRSGLDYWNNAGSAVEAAGGSSIDTLKELSSGFAQHPTFISTYGSMNNSDFVSAIYQNSLGRDGDAAGIAYWSGLLDNGTSRSDMVAEFMNASLTADLTTENYPTLSTAELAAAQERQDLITNKVEVALHFTNTLGSATNVTDSQNPESDSAYKASIEVIADVTTQSSTVNSAKGKINTAAANANAIESINSNWDTLAVTEGSNNVPVASPISTSSDLTSPYIKIALIATDADNDSLSYYLEDPYTGVDGSGYETAFIEPGTNQLHVVLKSDYTNNQVVLNYKVSDSIVFSNSATVTITIASSEDRGRGAQDENITSYSRVPTHYFDDSLLRSFTNEQPSSVDLSANMPTPGNQGQQNSCVGWAVAYALKSYQEKLEMGWELNSPNTIFSPAYIYNQINRGKDDGSIPSEALDLLINNGAATWSNMPYNVNDYLTQPSQDIHTHAANFKAKEYRKLTNKDQMKAALINKHTILIGILVNDSFSRIRGADSVYNTTGNYTGGHAVTVTGYDDTKYGGAFKVINSYGIDWGDNGYFWLPYNMLSEVLMLAYVVTDKANEANTDINEVPEPVRNDLPNLEVKEWNYNFDPIPGAAGKLKYTIINTGTGTAAANFDVNFMLSTDTTFDSSDIYVAYEEVPFDLEVGETAYRDDGNEMEFELPQTLQAGTYYMALWVDDLDEVDESNEGDNISLANDNVVIHSASQSDIIIDSWQTTWDASGNGVLEYRICNTGGSATKRSDWDINLMLSTTPNPADDANSYFIFYEDVEFILEPTECVYRDWYAPGYYNLYRDSYTGATVANGTYYISLWVDDQNLEEESNENNNYSTNDGTINISNRRGLQNEKRSAFNGRGFSKIRSIKQVEVVVDAKGKRSFRSVDNSDAKTSTYYQKTIDSRNKVVFPVTKKHAMPSRGGL